MADPYARAIWPGVEAPLTFGYTLSHGTQAAAAALTCDPQTRPPAEFGDLVITDDVTTVRLPGCKLDRIQVENDESGETWTLVILDRRWRWRDGAISGVFNQQDQYGKYLPWTVRTPRQLAEMCLRAMGEQRYEIRLPDVAVLPPVNWSYVPPAQALSALCDAMGCRVIYRLDTDSVLITPLGVGASLPATPFVETDGPELDLPERPSRLVVAGQPSRFQFRLKLQAVGLDWDGFYRPINDLSYAPKGEVKQQVVKITFPDNPNAGNRYSVRVNGDVTWTFTATASSAANVIQGLKALIDLDEAALGYSAQDGGTFLQIKGRPTGDPFTVEVFAEENGGGGTPTIEWELAEAGRDGKNPWASCPPPTFSGLLATDRLSRLQAIELARQSVFRCFRILVDNPDAQAGGNVVVPGYGPLVRREQVILQPTRVEQITPQPVDERPVDENNRPIKQLFYDGHSRDKPAAVYGRHFLGATGDGRVDGDLNSKPGSQVHVEFSIDPVHQVVTFGQFVFLDNNGRCEEPSLVLETGCNVRDPLTNAPLCFEAHLDTRGSGPPLYLRRDDVQLNVVGLYGDGNKLKGHTYDSADAYFRAGHYLAALAAQFRLETAQTRTYSDIVFVPLDGAIQQWTVNISESGCTTTVSRNSEHSTAIPPYPQRRKAEYLPPVPGVKRPGAANPEHDGPAPSMWEGKPQQFAE